MAQRCSACSHPEVSRLNECLRGGAEVLLPRIAREFSVTRFALMRHRLRHLTRGAAAAPVATEGEPGEVLELHDHALEPDSPSREREEHHAPRERRRTQRKAQAQVRIDSRRSTRAGRKAVPSDAKQRFLEEYAQSGNLKQSAAAAGVGRRMAYTWQEHDEAFALAFREAELEAVEALEAVARERATTGSKLVREVYRGDRLIERIVEYRPSDAVLVKLLQALRPEKYGDRLQVTQTQIVKTVEKDIWDAI